MIGSQPRQLPSLPMPALVVHGTDDPVVPLASVALVELTAGRVPNTVPRAIPGGRHGIGRENAEQVVGFVRELMGFEPA
jgi:pimeloyl-ACP methyl ester carboxylesterase